MDTPYMRRYELVPGFWDFEPPRPVKPMNTRTRKTVWKMRRRLANAPKGIRKRVLRRI